MKRAVALALIGLSLMEMPSCGKSKNLGHPNVSSSPGSTARTDESRRSEVAFFATWDPERDVTITWQADPRKGVVREHYGYFKHVEKDVAPGTKASILVENHGLGGETHCSVYVNDILLIPGPNAGWHPLHDRNDAGDCFASVIVP